MVVGKDNVCLFDVHVNEKHIDLNASEPVETCRVSRAVNSRIAVTGIFKFKLSNAQDSLHVFWSYKLS